MESLGVMFLNNEKNEKQNRKINTCIAGASYEGIQKYGSAAKEHLVAYSGNDYERGITLQKSLKNINKQSTNTGNDFTNQQIKAGWAAEVKDVAENNADNIISGKNERKIRYDDLGKANNELYDHVIIDADGNIISGTKSQMKFIGASASDSTGMGNAERALKKLQSKKFQKYIDNDVKIEVPKDEYQKMVDKATEEIEGLKSQLKKLKASGNIEAANKIENKIKKLSKLKSC